MMHDTGLNLYTVVAVRHSVGLSVHRNYVKVPTQNDYDDFNIEVSACDIR